MTESTIVHTEIKTKKYTKAKIKVALLAKIHGIPLNWISLFIKTRNRGEKKKLNVKRKKVLDRKTKYI